MYSARVPTSKCHRFPWKRLPKTELQRMCDEMASMGMAHSIWQAPVAGLHKDRPMRVVLRVVISFQVRDVVLNSRRDQTNYLQPHAQRAQPRAISLASVANAQLRSLALLCRLLETA